MAELARRTYLPKLYPVRADRQELLDVVERGVRGAGGRVIYNSFRERRVAPMYLGVEDRIGNRFGLLVYPFRATNRGTKHRPSSEHRAQIRLGDPARRRDDLNPVARDTAGVDVTLVLTIDPENEFIVGLDPLVYEDLPMGISVYYRDEHVAVADELGWAVWERDKSSGPRRSRVVELETVVGFHPERIFDYVRFEARASALGLNPALRGTLAEQYYVAPSGPHRLEEMFKLESQEILDIIDTNFRLGVAVRGGVAERHLERLLNDDSSTVGVEPIDADGQPDFRVCTSDRRQVLIECKTASAYTYADGDMKVEVQKTRDSGAGRQYTFDQFDIIAACTFASTGRWEFRFRWTRDLEPWPADPSRIKPIQRIDDGWARTFSDLLAQS